MKLSPSSLRFYKKHPEQLAIIEKMPEGISIGVAHSQGIINEMEKEKMLEFFCKNPSAYFKHFD